MKIVDIRPTTVTVPLEAPLRHASGAHWGRFVRTIIEVEADNGLIGVGEMGGGGESAELAFRGLKPYLLGHDPLQLEALRWKIMNPTASLYNNRTQLHAAIEFACIDLVGKHLNVRACDLLGGAVRDRVPFASYLFCRYAGETSGVGGETTPDEIVAHAAALREAHGFRAHKLKGGVFPPDYEVEVFRALASAFPKDRVRLDPNAVWSTETAIRAGHAIEDLNNDYYEDPCYGFDAMRRVRHFVRIPTATNTIVVNFEQLASNVRAEAVDVILLDTTFWGGLRQAYKAGQVLETFQLGACVHSSGELGVQLATMLHLGAALPNLNFAADAHYHHLVDDVIVGGKFVYKDGCIDVPTGPGLGVELDYDKLEKYHELYRERGGYLYDRDPGRKDWFGVLPDPQYADPAAREG